MSERPSEPLLQLLRGVARQKGLNTAAVAERAGIQRNRLKHVLAGSQPLTVDELIALSQALEIDAADLNMLESDTPKDPSEDKSLQPIGLANRRSGAALATVDDGPPPIDIDPWGNHAEQMLTLGFGLGCDIHIVLESKLLAGSGIPETTLSKFSDRLPLRFEAAFHHHHNPQFGEDGLQVTLSFDALYTCVLPWGSFQQVTLFPLAPEPPEAPTPEPPPKPSVARSGHLRLVE